jgi:hypothetical protein
MINIKYVLRGIYGAICEKKGSVGRDTTEN